MAKTSVELLSEILGTLVKIDGKLDIISAKKSDHGSPGVGSIALGTYFGSKFGKKGKSSDIKDLADSVEKLNKELNKTNIDKLNKLTNAISSYEKIPKENKLASRVSNVTSSAKEAASALLIMGASVVMFAGAFGIAKGILGVSPWEVLGFIVATAGALALTMIIISGSEAFSEKLSGGILSKATTFKGFFRNAKADRGRNKGAIQSAKDMGIALMYIAGGILSFSITMALVPRILGVNAGNAKAGDNLSTVGLGVLVITGVILGMGGVFYLLGMMGPNVAAGTAVAGAMALGMLVLAGGVFVFAKTAQFIGRMGKGQEITAAAGDKRSKFGQMMAGIGPGLGMMGTLLVSTALLFAGLGVPYVAAVVVAGSLVSIGMSIALISTAKAIREVNKIMDEMGGERGLKQTKENIRLMISGVMSGVISGIMGKETGIDKDASGTLSVKELVQLRRVKRAIRMLGNVAKSLSRFAFGLKAFAKLGVISSLDYKEDGVDEDGNIKYKPVLGEKIHVIEIAKAISDTFGMFIRTLISSTEGLSIKEARAIKKFSKALTGERGLISGVNQFATALQTFAKFGKQGRIATIEVDENGKQKASSASIMEIVNNIVNSFGEFVKQIANRSADFEEAGSLGTKMKRFNIALMGKKGVLGRETPGILSAISEFSNVLNIYSDYGKDGKIPFRDPKTGEIVPEKSIDTRDIATNMVSGISTFITALDKALGGNETLKGNLKNVEKRIENFSDIIGEFDKLAKSQEGMEKLANSLGLLATNMGTLVKNLDELKTDKLAALGKITAEHAVITKGTAIKTSYETSPTTTTSSAQPNWDDIADRIGSRIADKMTSPKGEVAKENWDSFAEKIGQKISERIIAMNSGEFQFRFLDPESLKGTLTVKR